MSKRILILDGDSIAYKCAAANEKRSILVTHKPSGKQQEFKHRTEFKAMMKQKNKEITLDYEVEDIQTPAALKNCLRTIKQHITRIEEGLWADEVVIYCGEKDNFRKQLPLPSEYKGQRKDNIRPVHLEAAKTYLHRTWGAKAAVGYEVDDACCIHGYEQLAKGNIPLLFHYEKDQNSHNGLILVDEVDEQLIEEVIPELGELWLDKNKKVKGTGLKFLCFQWIWADPVDNYRAYECSNVKFGEKSAYDVLKDLSSVQECLLAVIQQFKTFYPDEFVYKDFRGIEHKVDYKHMLEMYYACCWMKRSKTDDSKPHLLFEQYGVQYD